MIRHKPEGLGHPYRCEPFQCWPALPIAGEPWAIYVVTDDQVKSVNLHLKSNGALEVIALVNLGVTSSQDRTPYGATSKEIFSNTHLEDAAVRSGEYPGQIAWGHNVAQIADVTNFSYHFITNTGETSETFLASSMRWNTSSERYLKINGLPELSSKVSAPEFLLGPEGIATKTRFKIVLNPNDKVVGFGERFHSVVQNGEYVDAVVYEEYKGQGHRTYLPMPFAHVIGANFAFHIKTSTNTRYFVSPLAIHVEVDLVSGQDPLEIDLFAGSPQDSLRQFLVKTGQPVLPPEWVFDLWISSNEWNTQDRVESELGEATSAGIDVGVVVIEAWSDESTFVVFRDAQFDTNDGLTPLKASDISYPAEGAWPNPKQMIDKMHENETKLIVWQIPILREEGDVGSQSHALWNRALTDKMVIEENDGTPYRVKGFWFHGGLLPDLSRADVRKWWVDQRRYLVEELGVDGFKTDGGEHAWGEDLIYSEGRFGKEMNNLFAVHYAQAFNEMMDQTSKPAVTFSRAGFTGSSAYSLYWAGDENSTWPAFRASINAGITAGASGIFFWGWDIGGFSGDIPSAELYLRGTAMATFCPIMQVHSEFNHHQVPSNDRTPWNLTRRHNDPSIVSIFKKFVEVRKSLREYLVAESAFAISSGRPLMAGLFFDYPDDDHIWDAPTQYLLGRDLLVCPVTSPGVTQQRCYLPAGEWTDIWSGRKHAGGQWIEREVPLDEIAVFSKSNFTLNTP